MLVQRAELAEDRCAICGMLGYLRHWWAALKPTPVVPPNGYAHKPMVVDHCDVRLPICHECEMHEHHWRLSKEPAARLMLLARFAGTPCSIDDIRRLPARAMCQLLDLVAEECYGKIALE